MIATISYVGLISMLIKFGGMNITKMFDQQVNKQTIFWFLVTLIG
jgi:hypothetical protein